MLVGEDGPYRPACRATPWAAGRQVWGPPFPEHQHYYFCHCYRYFHITLLLNTLLQILSYPGVPKLTTQLLILENILCLPLCRINKFGLNTLPSMSPFWERGSPDLPVCAVRPIFINKALKTLARGQASRGGRRKTSSGAASPGRLARSGDIKAGQASRGSRDVSHDDQDQAGASARSVLVSSLVLRRQA